jgi:flavin-dependent dehydrogenase
MTDLQINTDVVILGAGPAGVCAALSLLTYSSLNVLVLEHSDFSQVRVGEHVSDSIFTLLDHLKLQKSDFPPHCFLPCYGDTTYWGSDMPRVRHAIFSSENASVQLDRESFDFTLMEQMVARGGQLFPRTHCTVTRTESEWLLHCTHPAQPPFRVNPRYLLDASGRNSSVCRQLGGQVHKLDQLMGAGFFFSCPEHNQGPQEQWIESTEYGWWYAAQLPDQQYVATFFSDQDIISKLRLNQRQHWLAHLQQSQHLKRLITDYTALSAHPWLRNAGSQYSDSSSLPNYLAIGDAACAFDPISSMGLGFALSSACHAAQLVTAELQYGVTPAKDLYQQDLQAHFTSYQQLRRYFYQTERRWSNAPFWQRRQTI